MPASERDFVNFLDRFEAARAEQARSAAQLNAIRAEDLRKIQIPITIVLQVHDLIFQAIAAALKSVLAKSGVWVRIPSSAPSKISIMLGKLDRICDFVGCERSRTKTHENTIHSSSIRQAIREAPTQFLERQLAPSGADL